MNGDKLANIIWKGFSGLVGLGIITVIGIKGYNQYKYNTKLSNPDSIGVYVIKKGENIWNSILEKNCPSWMRKDDYLHKLTELNQKNNKDFDPNKVFPGEEIKVLYYK